MNNALLATYGRATVPMQFVGTVDSSAAEYQWLAANVPDASVIGQSLIDHGGRFHDVLRVASPAGVRDYQFDVTAFMGTPTRAAGAARSPDGSPFTFERAHLLPENVRRRFAHAPASDELSDRFLGHHGIVSVGSGVTEQGPSIVVYVNGSGDEARRRLPAFWGNVPVVVREGGPIVPQWYGAAEAVAPAGDAASDLLTGVLGPLIQSGQLDRLGNQVIDRVLAQPEVQRTIGDAIGKAAVKELSQGVGRPYMTGITVAAGVGALSLLALAALYAAKR